MLQIWNHCLQIGIAHGVNPWIFGALYLAHHPLFWGTFTLIVLRVRQRRPVKALAVLDTFFWFMPYLYIVVFGHGLPWWIYALVLLALALGAPHALRQIRHRLHPAE